jgi:hypothetical protein
MNIYLSTWLTDRSLGNSMTKKKASKRLLSYFFLKEQDISQEHFDEYVETGRCDPRKRK